MEKRSSPQLTPQTPAGKATSAEDRITQPSENVNTDDRGVSNEKADAGAYIKKCRRFYENSQCKKPCEYARSVSCFSTIC
ncbi:MAG: hypothetical protein E7434_03155 [Ruminococcaceae bacterium]|nr:hypothetical protein [Oscillospiraceae bacterium]